MTAEVQRIAVALERIANALEVIVAGSIEPAPEEAPGCQHPEDTRVSFGVTDGVADWQCGVCGFRTVGEVIAHG